VQVYTVHAEDNYKQSWERTTYNNTLWYMCVTVTLSLKLWMICAFSSREVLNLASSLAACSLKLQKGPQISLLTSSLLSQALNKLWFLFQRGPPQLIQSLREQAASEEAFYCYMTHTNK